ncbi:phage late control D family protein [Pseudomonas sp. QL9]|uniref:phage late control D family protein n=1 Tax=Pseudomonas sp. QL9 TaxID=3242725 RepID=UPI00352B23E7
MQPTFRLIADGNDITKLLSARLLSLTLSDKTGQTSDTLELVLDDRDGKIELPRRGALLDVLLGYQRQELTPMGRYKVDTVACSGPPRKLTLSGRASDMRGEAKSGRCAAWEDVSLAYIVSELAARNGWGAHCPVQVSIARAEQLIESDYNFITRLAKQYDCTAKVADGQLLVLPRESGQSASGQPIEPLVLMPMDVSSYSIRFDDRSVYKAVRTLYPDLASGGTRQFELKNPKVPEDVTAIYTERHPYADRAAAVQAAKSRLAALNRASASVQLQMPGRADLFAERKLRLSAFKNGLDGDYLCESVEHQFDGGGWRTSVTCNGGADGKALAGATRPKQASGQ